jgi:hypothetical protein
VSDRFKVGVKLLAPDDAPARLIIDTDVGALRRLLKQVENSGDSYMWPASDLRQALREVIANADSTVWGSDA